MSTANRWPGKPYGPADAPLVEFLMWLDVAQPFELEAFGVEGRVSSHTFYYDIEGWTDRILTPSPASS